MHEILEKLAAIAAELDKKGKIAEADILDSVLNKLADGLTPEQKAQVESLFPTETPKATPEQMEAHRKEQAEKAKKQKALENVQRRQRQVRDFSGLAPKSMEGPDTDVYHVEEVHTKKPKDDGKLPPRVKPLPTP